MTDFQGEVFFQQHLSCSHEGLQCGVSFVTLCGVLGPTFTDLTDAVSPRKRNRDEVKVWLMMKGGNLKS